MVSPRAQKVLDRAKEHPTQRKLAIHAKCVDCVGGGDCPEWYKNIKECPVTKCALHAFRPYK